MELVATKYKQTEVGLIPEDWKVDQVKNFSSITTGGSDTQDKSDNGLYPFYVRSQNVEKINTYSFEGEAVLTSGDGVGVGKIFHYANGKFDFHQRVYSIYGFNKVDGKYFYLQFSSRFFDRVMSMTAKSSVDSVRMEMIADMKIPLPPTLTEQKAIARVLSDTDALIHALEKKIAKKKLIKKGAMQELLKPKEGWITKNLPEVCWFQEGPGLRNWQFTSSGVKVINVTNLVKGYLDLDKTDRHISQSEFEKMYKHFLIDENDIVMASSGNSYSKVSIVRKQDLPLLMNTSVIRFKPLKNLSYNWLLTFLKSTDFKDQIDLLITGGAQPNFGPYHLNRVQISYPNDITIQEQISSTIVSMDKEIKQLEQKLSKYKKVKQGLMQQLLTGKIRVV